MDVDGEDHNGRAHKYLNGPLALPGGRRLLRRGRGPRPAHPPEILAGLIEKLDGGGAFLVEFRRCSWISMDIDGFGWIWKICMELVKNLLLRVIARRKDMGLRARRSLLSSSQSICLYQMKCVLPYHDTI